MTWLPIFGNIFPMVNGHSTAAEWGTAIADGLIAHVAALMADGMDYAAARAVAIANSVAGPMTIRRVDQHFSH